MSKERADALRNSMCQLLSATGGRDMECIAKIARDALTRDNELLDKSSHQDAVDESCEGLR